MTGLEIRLNVGTVTIDDSMVVESSDFIPYGEYNPHNVRPWIIGHEHGAFCVVFASDAQTAIDIAIDAGKMDFLRVSDEDYAAMSEEEQNECLTGGNAGEPFDQSYLWMEDIHNPRFSFCALLAASQLARAAE
jgi:hypothetical protein